MSPTTADRLLIWGLWLMALLAVAILGFILLFLVRESVPALLLGPVRFLTDEAWHPTGGSFRLAPMVCATLLVSAGAVLLATPLGILSALFCLRYAPSGIGTWYRRLVEVLAGIPSVVYGFWGLVVLVPLIARWQPPGASLLSGVLILTIMILPTIALFSLAALKSVPEEQLRAAAALGLSRRARLRHILLPGARRGLFTAILLGCGRAVGETMAVLMVCGNVVQVPETVFEPVRTLTANIALEMAYALDLHRSALFLSGLLLTLIVIGLVGMADWVSGEVADAG